MAELMFPNVMGNVLAMGEAGKKSRLANEAEARKNQFNALSAQALTGDPDAYAQQVAIDPAQAMQVQKAGDISAQRVRGAAKYMQQALASNNPAQIQGAWNAVRPFLASAGAAQGMVPPEQWDPALMPGLQEALAKTAYLDEGNGNDLKSLRVGQDGYYYAIRGGQLVNTGIQADARTQLRDQPGLQPGLVDLRTGTVSPLSAAGGQPAISPPQGSALTTIQAEDGSLMPVTQFIGPNGQRINVGNDLLQVNGMPGQGTQPTQVPQGGLVAPRPAISPAEAERLRLSQEANARAAEANDRAARAEGRASLGNAPAGFRFREDGSLEPIPGAPAPNKSNVTASEQKAATLLQRMNGSLAQLQAAVEADPGAASPSVSASIAGSLPFVGDAARNALNSSERQRVEAAQLDILDAALTLGTGAAYTKEQLEGYRRAYFPQLGDTEETVRDKAARLTNVIEAARIAAGSAAPSGSSSNPTGNPNAPVRIQSAADYDALPSGALYVAPDGTQRRKR